MKRQVNNKIILLILVILLGVAFIICNFINTFFKEDEFMVTFIAQKIEEARDISLEKGQAKYRAYFVRKSAKKLYGRYQEDVDTILTTDSYEDAIVSE